MTTLYLKKAEAGEYDIHRADNDERVGVLRRGYTRTIGEGFRATFTQEINHRLKPGARLDYTTIKDAEHQFLFSGVELLRSKPKQ